MVRWWGCAMSYAWVGWKHGRRCKQGWGASGVGFCGFGYQTGAFNREDGVLGLVLATATATATAMAMATDLQVHLNLFASYSSFLFV